MASASLSLNEVQWTDSGGNSGLFIGVINVASRCYASLFQMDIAGTCTLSVHWTRTRHRTRSPLAGGHSSNAIPTTFSWLGSPLKGCSFRKWVNVIGSSASFLNSTFTSISNSPQPCSRTSNGKWSITTSNENTKIHLAGSDGTWNEVWRSPIWWRSTSPPHWLLEDTLHFDSIANTLPFQSYILLCCWPFPIHQAIDPCTKGTTT